MVELTGDNDKNKKDIYYKLRMVCMYYIHNLSKHSHSPCFFFFFSERISSISGWPEICSELSELTSSTAQEPGLNVYSIIPRLYSAGDKTKCFVHTKQTVYQQNHISRPILNFLLKGFWK